VTQRGGKEVKLQGSRTPSAVGEVQYFVLAPAEYVVDDIAEETAEARYQRIHEQCAVLRLGFDSTWVMLTGDADRDAWEKHITSYHEERLPSQVLSAAHHGSRTFFRHDEDEEPFRDALQKIAPDYVVISAPKRSESPFGHPHEDAVREYADQVGDDNVLHTGKMRYSFVCDVFRDGTYQITDDGGELAKAYHVGGNEPENDGGSGGKARQAPAPAVVVTRVDRRPMGTH
jgi:competence protein ComEC